LVLVNKLSTVEKSRVISALVEGNSLRAVTRMTGVHRTTVRKLLCDLGAACSEYQDRVFRDLKCKRVQCDEIWSFVGAKEKNCSAEMKKDGKGYVWTWVALDADTELVPCWFIGNRDAGCAYHYIHDLAGRLANRVQLTTDCHKDFKHISTSFVERQNLTMRMSMRRFTRLTNGFSKKVENLEAAVALHYMHYNFCCIHQSLRVTPAMEAGVAKHVWNLDEVVTLLN
jgi:IS1 family transposase